MVTFQVHNVKPGTERYGRSRRPLSVVDALAKSGVKPEAWGTSAGESGIEAWTHPLLEAVRCAWHEHRPLRLTPDAVWLTIAQGFAEHVRQNAEALRSRFVDFQGSMYIEVRRDAFVKGSAANDWPSVFGEFSGRIAEYIGDQKRNLVVCDYSTTTPLMRIASEIVLMDAMSGYFSYGMRTLCGFPQIELAGTVEDWEDIHLRASVLGEFDTEWWAVPLLDVTAQLVETARGSPDLDFWKCLYSESGGSGGPYCSGWVNMFYPYLTRGRRNPVVERGWGSGARRLLSGPCPDSFPSGMSQVPFQWRYYTENFPMRFLGGFCGVDVRDGALEPAYYWAVADAPRLGTAPEAL